MSLTGLCFGATLIVTLISAYTDLRYGKVYNLVTVPALALGLGANAVASGWHGLLLSLAGVGVALALWLLSLACGGCMGGGDIKLLGAVGALCGPHFLVAAFVMAIFLGGLFAILLALRHRCLGSVLSRLYTWIVCKLGFGCTTQLSPDRTLRVPYALPIALGVVICLVKASPLV